MKKLIVLLCLLFSISLLAKDKLVATPTNSPVKETYLKVRLEGFSSFSKVLFKPKNGGTETEGEVVKEGQSFIGKFKASFLKPGKYEYRVRIRTSSGQSAQNEAASVAFINFAIDSSLEVADPGEDGKKTLAGRDEDNSGVRDDVQRWINETYNDKVNIKKALKQLAKAAQNKILNANNQQQALIHILASHKAVNCLFEREIEAGMVLNEFMLQDFETVTYNTVDRLEAYAKNLIHAKDVDLAANINRKDPALVCD